MQQPYFIKNRPFIAIGLILISGASWGATPGPAKTQTAPTFVSTFLGAGPLSMRTVYSNGFERLQDFVDFYIVPQNYLHSSREEFTTVRRVGGTHSLEAYIYAKNSIIPGRNTNHRSYPTFQMEKTSAGIIRKRLLIQFYAWANFRLTSKRGSNWFSLATLTSYNDPHWYRTVLVNVDSQDRIHLVHVPHQFESKPDIYDNQSIRFPMKQWVKISIYIDYSDHNRFHSPIVAVWQNSVLVSASRFDNRIDLKAIPSAYPLPACLRQLKQRTVKRVEAACGMKYVNGLAQMHFGLYAPPLLSSGVIYNDNLTVSKVLRH